MPWFFSTILCHMFLVQPCLDFSLVILSIILHTAVIILHGFPVATCMFLDFSVLSFFDDFWVWYFPRFSSITCCMHFSWLFIYSKHFLCCCSKYYIGIFDYIVQYNHAVIFFPWECRAADSFQRACCCPLISCPLLCRNPRLRPHSNTFLRVSIGKW